MPHQDAEPANSPPAKRRRLEAQTEGRESRCFVANLGKLSLAALVDALGPMMGSVVSAGEARGRVDAVVSDGCGKDPKSLRVDAACGALDVSLVTRRAAFHELMQVNDHGFVVTESVVLTRNGSPPTLPRDGVWFFRPDGDTDGRHLRIVAQQRDLERVWRDWASRGPGSQAVLSASVPRLLLLANGHKFHVRLYVFAVSGTRGSRVGLLRRGQLVSARLPHTNHEADETNPEIHCSHMRNGPVMQFPEDYPGDSGDFFDRVAYRLRRVFWLAPSVDRIGKLNAVAGDKLVMQFPWPKTCAGGLSLLACDFLVDTLGRLFLLKMSDSPRYLPSGHSPEDMDALSRIIFAGLAEFAVDDPGPGAALHHVQELWRTPTVMPVALTLPLAGARTYLPAVEWLDVAAFHRTMAQVGGWRPVTLDEAKHVTVDLLVVDGRWNTDRRLYSLNARLKARLDAKRIENKVALQELVEPHFPGLMPAAIICGEHERFVAFPGEGVWIWRPHGEFSGKGVVVIPDQATLDRVVAQKRPGKRAVLSRYILDPLLLAGVKFHVRLNILIVAGRAGKRAAVYHRGYINRATLPYVAADFGNGLVHDSHTQKNLPLPFPAAYPGGLAEARLFFDKSCDMLGHVCRLAFPSINCYEDCESAFEVFGADLMVDSAGRVYLLEINSKPGYPHNTAEWASEMTESIVGGIVEFATVDPGIVDPASSASAGGDDSVGAGPPRTTSSLVHVREVARV